MEKKSIILGIIRLAFLALWVSVAVEKLWDLGGFHSTLRRQPIPAWSTDILFWLLPLAELSAAVLLAWPRSRKRTHQGMWLSAFLMLAFTLFIGFGVLGWYEKRPCGLWVGHQWAKLGEPPMVQCRFLPAGGGWHVAYMACTRRWPPWKIPKADPAVPAVGWGLRSFRAL
ncbi:MAG TPA: MauE/DoxX family redox-associated membrane protein [Parapedobacter sp.]|nr:MauE/DoxX family redox-associated membrane protein [Parapedobacter sp.]